MKDLLSVIVPVYNVDKYLDKCLSSIICQTYENLQIILVDDGSTDKSGCICDKFAKIDKRIQVIHQENQGLSCARNVGIEKSIGKYIAFVDSDDYLERTMYSDLMFAISHTNCDIASCGVNYVDEKGVIIEDKIFDGVLDVYSREDVFAGLYTSEKIRFEVWNKIFKRDIIGETRFVPRQVYEDVNFDREVFQRINRFAYLHKPLYNYLQKREGNTNSYFSSKKFCVFDELDKFIKDLQALYGSNSVVQKFKAIKVRFILNLIYSAIKLNAEKKDINYLSRLLKHECKTSHKNRYLPKMSMFICSISPKLYVALSDLKSKSKVKVK